MTRRRCVHWHAFADGEDRQCPRHVGWIARLFGGVICHNHARAVTTHPNGLTMRVASVAAFLLLAVAANVLTAEYGMIPVGLGLIATAGTWAAGLVLLARDWVHDTAGRWAVLGCIAAGAALSWAMTNPALALASGAAFAISELADLAVYTPLRRRGWAKAAIASNLVGSAVDTVVFLALAGFPIWQAMPGQMLAKTTATVAVVAGAVITRALLRDRIGTARV